MFECRSDLLSYLVLLLQREVKTAGSWSIAKGRCHRGLALVDLVVLCSERCSRDVDGSYHHHQSHASSAKKNSRLYQDLDGYSYSLPHQILQRNWDGSLSYRTPHQAFGRIHSPQVSWAIACSSADPKAGRAAG